MDIVIGNTLSNACTQNRLNDQFTLITMLQETKPKKKYFKPAQYYSWAN